MKSAEGLPSFARDEFTYSESPNPSFAFGQKVDATPAGKVWLDGEKEGWVHIDTDTADPGSVTVVSAKRNGSESCTERITGVW